MPIENLRRIFGRQPQPAMRGESVLISARDERRKNDYLKTLAEADRTHLTDFLGFTRKMKGRLGTTHIAVTAVGSSTRLESERHHPVADIDLRILNSEEPRSDARHQAIAAIRDEVRGYLQRTGASFEEDDCTEKSRMVKESSGGLIPFIDWYNSDPSFTVQYDEGLPLHISISGADNYALGEYLQLEAQRKTSTVILEG